MADSKNNIPDIALNNQSLQEQVYEILCGMILDGSLAPGSSLNTNELSRRFNVSRTPIRDAVNKLVAVGLANKSAHREATVADYMTDEMYEIFYARSRLESMAESFAATGMSPQDKEKLLKMAHGFEELGISGDGEKFRQLDEDFHFFIYDSMKTAYLREVMKRLYIMTKVNRDAAFSNQLRKNEIIQEHLQIAQAIYEGDAKTAEQAGFNHHKNTLKHLREQYEAIRKGSGR